MMQKDDDLDIITEAYFTKRFHSPRINLSPEFMAILKKEFQSHLQAGVNSKRIVKAIEYAVNSMESSNDIDTNIEKLPKMHDNLVKNLTNLKPSDNEKE